ncbi:hypothetical protein [Moorena sp. SIOASIH]|uniref:hypothetical protein n=1 Tax=Moorena sp. SIOASIH TaxID=2607817 RepID=UPI0025EE06C9|nr:hypothetical protein [Moorena sp. SIOASIH]
MKNLDIKKYLSLKKIKSTVGHTGTWILDPNAYGELSSTLSGSDQVEQDGSVK